MEPTHFNLQRTIDAYIASVNKQGTLTSADVMELTAHLYDATADLQQNNLTEEEAFLIACKRLGKESVLTEEYGKVNPSVNTNKIWAYLFIGFNALYTLPSLLLLGIIGFYYGIHYYFNYSNTAYILVTLFHLVFMGFVWFMVKQKNTISQFIEKEVNKNTMRITMFSTLPLLLFFILNPKFMALRINDALFYPMREWNSSIVEFTYYMAVLSVVGAVLSLLFTINNSSKITLERLFEKPSILFLLCFGVFIEVFAASTRSLNFGTILKACLFGCIYLIATFLITYYNKKRTLKYILFFIAFGLSIEIGFGIRSDLGTGNFSHTTYFTSALIVGVLAGYFLGKKNTKANLITQSV